jgi:hypothetical protein
MQRTYVWLIGLCALAINAAACDGDVDFGGFDGSLFDDAGSDAATPRHDASVDDSDEDGGADVGEGGDASVATDGGGDAGASSTADAGPSAKPGTLVPSQLAAALCAALADCYDSAELRDDALGGQDCMLLNEGAYANSDLAYLPASIEAGLVEFDAGAMDDCTRDIRALGCKARASRLPSSCKAALAGTVLIAGECTINLDCKGDAFCDKGELATCPGVCSPLQAEDFPCNHDDDDQCQDGLVCSGGTCRALRAVGQSCGEQGQTGCAPGLECADLGLGDGEQCVDIAAIYTAKLGDDCDANDALCEPGLVCESVSGTTGVCAKPVGRGASCKRALPNQCPVGQYCDAVNAGEAGTCVDAPGEGQACRTRAPACATGLLCIDDVCRPRLDNGEDCIDDRQCFSGVCTAVCEAPLACEAP